MSVARRVFGTQDAGTANLPQNANASPFRRHRHAAHGSVAGAVACLERCRELSLDRQPAPNCRLRTGGLRGAGRVCRDGSVLGARLHILAGSGYGRRRVPLPNRCVFSTARSTDVSVLATQNDETRRVSPRLIQWYLWHCGTLLPVLDVGKGKKFAGRETQDGWCTRVRHVILRDEKVQVPAGF